MAFKTKAEPRKQELTSMIDMIFLLLIFFLVTLSTETSTTEKGGRVRVTTRQINEPASESNLAVDVVIYRLYSKELSQPYIWMDLNNVGQVKNVIGSNPSLSGLNPSISQGVLSALGTGVFGANALKDKYSLSSLVRQGHKVAISAHPMQPFGDLFDVYDLLSKQNAQLFWSDKILGDLKDVPVEIKQGFSPVYLTGR